jgi:hypothetical protein
MLKFNKLTFSYIIVIILYIAVYIFYFPLSKNDLNSKGDFSYFKKIESFNDANQIDIDTDIVKSIKQSNQAKSIFNAYVLIPNYFYYQLNNLQINVNNISISTNDSDCKIFENTCALKLDSAILEEKNVIKTNENLFTLNNSTPTFIGFLIQFDDTKEKDENKAQDKLFYKNLNENLKYNVVSNLIQTNNVNSVDLLPEFNDFIPSTESSNFALINKDEFPSSRLNNLFADISMSLSDQQIFEDKNKQTNQTKNTEIIEDNEYAELKYSINESGLTLYITQGNDLFGNSNSESKVIYNNENIKEDVILKKGNLVYKLENGASDALFTIQKDDKFNLYKLEKSILKNGSFDLGLWQDQVENCKSNVNQPEIYSKIVKDEDINVLQLGSKNQLACSWVDVAINANSDYILQFNSRNLDKGKYSYGIDLDYDNINDMFEEIKNPDEDWIDTKTIINTPYSTENIKLTLYSTPFEDNKNYNRTEYKNIQLNKLEFVENIHFDPESGYKKLKDEDHSFEEISSFRNTFNSRNLIRNGSFENGLWNNQVSDCQNYDENPIISMNLNQTLASDKKVALELGAKRHIACTAQENIKILGGQQYYFDFDLQSFNSDIGGYSIIFNDSDSSNVYEKVKIKDVKWDKHSIKFVAPENATSATLFVYGFPSNSNDISTTRYDNFRLHHIPYLENRFFEISKIRNLSLPENTLFTSGLLFQKIDIINASTGFYIVLNDQFSENIILSSSNISKSNNANLHHISLNNEKNGWYIDLENYCKSGLNNCSKNDSENYSFTLYIRHKYQLEIILIISLISFIIIGNITILAWSKWKILNKSDTYKPLNYL